MWILASLVFCRKYFVQFVITLAREILARTRSMEDWHEQLTTLLVFLLNTFPHSCSCWMYRSHALMCLLHKLLGTSKPSREFYLSFFYVSLNVRDLVDRNCRVTLSELCAISGFFLFGCHWFFSIKMPFGQTVFISCFYPCCGMVLLFSSVLFSHLLMCN